MYMMVHVHSLLTRDFRRVPQSIKIACSLAPARRPHARTPTNGRSLKAASNCTRRRGERGTVVIVRPRYITAAVLSAFRNGHNAHGCKLHVEETAKRERERETDRAARVSLVGTKSQCYRSTALSVYSVSTAVERVTLHTLLPASRTSPVD